MDLRVVQNNQPVHASFVAGVAGAAINQFGSQVGQSIGQFGADGVKKIANYLASEPESQVMSPKRSRGEEVAPPQSDPAGIVAPQEAGYGGLPGSGNQILASLLPSVSSHGPTTSKKTFRLRNNFCIPITTKRDWPQKLIPLNGGGKGVITEWVGIPWKSQAMYMDVESATLLENTTLGHRFTRASFRLTNFTTHTGNMSGGGAPTINQTYGGIGFHSVVGSSRTLGKYFICNKAKPEAPLQHEEVHDYMASAHRDPHYKDFPYRLTQVAHNYYYTKDKHTGVAVRRLEDYANYSLSAPSNIEFHAFPKQKHWYSGRIARAEQAATYQVGVGDRLKDKFINTLPVDKTSANEIYNGNAQCWGIHPATYLDHEKKIMAPFKNIMPQNAAPISFYSANDNSAINSVTQDPDKFNGVGNIMGNASPHTENDLFAFKIEVPPTLNDADPNVMVSFTMETELEVEYIDALNVADNRMLEYVTDNGTDFDFVQPRLTKLAWVMKDALTASINGDYSFDPKNTIAVPWADHFPITDQRTGGAHYSTMPGGHDSVGYVGAAQHLGSRFIPGVRND